MKRPAGRKLGGLILSRRYQSKSRHALWFLFLFLFVSSTGCALQSSVVDMEGDMETLKRHQRELQSRLERVEKEKGSQASASSAPAAAAPKGQADLATRLDLLGTDLQGLSGRVEEKDHLLTMTAKRIEDQSFRIEELLNRLDNLEARVIPLEKSGGRTPPAAAVSTSMCCRPAGGGSTRPGCANCRTLRSGRLCWPWAGCWDS